MFVGVDGCRDGWVAIGLAENGDWGEADVLPDVSHLWNKHATATLILVDIPLGLRDSGPEERRCDRLARKLIGPPRASSVFRAPCRPAVYAKSKDEANCINEMMTGRKLPLQTREIIDKICQMDVLLCGDRVARSRVREIHPEMCFWALNKCQPMKHSKKKRAGREERIQVLETVCPQTREIVEYAKHRFKDKKVSVDDLLDALAAAVTAMMGGQALHSIPKAGEFDSKGLRMEMVYFPLHAKCEIERSAAERDIG